MDREREARLKSMARNDAYNNMMDDTDYYRKCNLDPEEQKVYNIAYDASVRAADAYEENTMHGDQRDSDWSHFHPIEDSMDDE